MEFEEKLNKEIIKNEMRIKKQLNQLAKYLIESKGTWKSMDYPALVALSSTVENYSESITNSRNEIRLYKKWLREVKKK